MPEVPPRPWLKGEQESYSSLVLEVSICLDEHGRVFSAHGLQDKQDVSTAMKWSSGGQEQVAHGMLTEAVRREALLDLLIQMSRDPEFLPRLKAASPEERETALKKMAVSLHVQMANTISRIAAAALGEAYLTVSED